MLRIRRILVGVDLEGDRVGATASLAIEQARAIAARSGADVTLLHSTRADEKWDPGEESFGHAPEHAASQYPGLDAVAATLREAGIACQVVTSDASAGLAIVKHVLREDTDLVVVGKRTIGKHDGRRMGSVALNVVRHCPCLVSVVRPESPPLPSLIVAATDAGDVGARVIDAAGGLASICGSELHVIHAITLGMDVQLEGEQAEQDYVRQRRAELRAKVEAQATEAGFTGEVQVHAGVTTPSRAVLEAVDRLHPGLVVLGTISRGGVPGLLVGNTAERLLGMLDCSLVVAKPADFVSPVQRD